MHALIFYFRGFRGLGYGGNVVSNSAGCWIFDAQTLLAHASVRLWRLLGTATPSIDQVSERQTLQLPASKRQTLQKSCT